MLLCFASFAVQSTQIPGYDWDIDIAHVDSFWSVSMYIVYYHNCNNYVYYNVLHDGFEV